MVRIDIWSDIACPFCYIGKRHLETALAGESAEVVWHSFELDPTAPDDGERRDVVSVLMAKYRQSRPQIEAMMERVAAMGAASGLRLRLKDSIRARTFDAHRLLHLAAAEFNLQDAAKERLLRAYFTEGAHLGEHETLVRLMAEVGLPAERVAAVLAGDDYAAAVRADAQEAQALRIQGVPFFVFEGRYAISGAQPVAVFREVLETCRAEAAAAAPVSAPVDGTCTPDGCAV